MPRVPRRFAALILICGLTGAVTFSDRLGAGGHRLSLMDTPAFAQNAADSQGERLREFETLARLGPSMDEQTRRDALAKLERSHLTPTTSVSKLSADELAAIGRALTALNAGPERRAEVQLAWAKDESRWAKLSAKDLTTIVDALAQTPPLTSGPMATPTTLTHRQTLQRLCDFAWSTHLEQSTKGGAPSAEVARLAAATAGRLGPDQKKAIKDWLNATLIEKPDVIKSYKPSDVLALERALRSVDNDPKGLRPAMAFVSWAKAGAGEKLASEADLRDTARILQILTSQVHTAAYREARDALAQVIWFSYMTKPEWIKQNPGAFAALAAASAQEGGGWPDDKGGGQRSAGVRLDQRPQLKELIKSNLIDDTSALAKMDAADLRRIWTAGVISGVAEEDLRKMNKAWFAAASGRDQTPRGWTDLLITLSSAQRVGNDPNALADARKNVVERAADRLSAPDFYAKHPMTEIGVMARALATASPEGERQTLRDKLINAWVGKTGAYQSFFAKLDYERFIQVQTALRQLGNTEAESTLLVAHWISAGSALKLSNEGWSAADAWQLSQMISTLAPLKADAAAKTSWATLLTRAKAQLANEKFLSASNSSDTAAFAQSLAPHLTEADAAAGRKALFTRLAVPPSEDLTRPRVGDVLELSQADLLCWGQALFYLSGEKVSLEKTKAGPGHATISVDTGASLLTTSGGAAAMVAQGLGQAFKDAEKLDAWSGRVDQALHDAGFKSLPGDKRAAWFLARAYIDEIQGEITASPLLGLKWVEQAMGAAESEPLRLACVRWIFVRRLAVQQFAEAEGMIKSVGGQFQSPLGKSTLASLNAALTPAKQAEEWRQNQLAAASQIAQLEGQLQSLQRTLEDAKKKGKSKEDLDSIERLIANTKTKLAELR